MVRKHVLTSLLPCIHLDTTFFVKKKYATVVFDVLLCVKDGHVEVLCFQNCNVLPILPLGTWNGYFFVINVHFGEQGFIKNKV